MGFTSIWHWIIVLLIVLLLFGAGKLPKVMGDLAKGIKNFKSGLKDEDEGATDANGNKVLPNQPAPPPAAAPTVAPVPTTAASATTVPPASTAAPAGDVKKDETART